MNIKAITRKFTFKGKELEDPNAKMTIQQVKEFYSSDSPELVNAIWEEKADGDKLIIEFKTAVGKKG